VPCHLQFGKGGAIAVAICMRGLCQKGEDARAVPRGDAPGYQYTLAGQADRRGALEEFSGADLLPSLRISRGRRVQATADVSSRARCEVGDKGQPGLLSLDAAKLFSTHLREVAKRWTHL